MRVLIALAVAIPTIAPTHAAAASPEVCDWLASRAAETRQFTRPHISDEAVRLSNMIRLYGYLGDLMVECSDEAARKEFYALRPHMLAIAKHPLPELPQ